MFQETNINSANLRSTLLNIARTNGVKIPGAKSSMCEIELSCELPVNGQSPDWNYAPIVQKTSIMSAGNYNFELSEDVNFHEQFNSDGYSNRTFVPKRNSNGVITAYTVSKTTLAVNGSSRIFKKVFDAWRQHQVIKMTYHTPNKKESVFCFEPHILAFRNGVWYAKGGL